MRRLFRWTLKASVGLLLVVAVIVVAGLGYREWRHYSAAPRFEIATPTGIDEAMYVDINGRSQWVTIRGQDRNKPVVFFLHGGPGTPMGGFAQFFLDWERDYVVVHWDQPGAGRTYRAAGREIDPGMTVEQMANDGNQLAAWLIDHLGTDRLIALGWSWGSALGVYMTQARPDLYAAFIGTGQFVNALLGEEIAYANVLSAAEQRADSDALESLARIGPPPYESMQELSSQRGIAISYELDGSIVSAMLASLWEPRTTLSDIYDSIAGSGASSEHFFGSSLDGPLIQLDLKSLSPRFDVPVYLIQGVEDNFTPAALAEDYFEFVDAPDKAYFPIAGAGHFAILTHAERFRAMMQQAMNRR